MGPTAGVGLPKFPGLPSKDPSTLNRVRPLNTAVVGVLISFWHEFSRPELVLPSIFGVVGVALGVGSGIADPAVGAIVVCTVWPPLGGCSVGSLCSDCVFSLPCFVGNTGVYLVVTSELDWHCVSFYFNRLLSSVLC